MSMTPHVHVSPVNMIATVALVLAVFGTIHLFTLTRDDRFSKAWRTLNP